MKSGRRPRSFVPIEFSSQVKSIALIRSCEKVYKSEAACVFTMKIQLSSCVKKSFLHRRLRFENNNKFSATPFPTERKMLPAGQSSSRDMLMLKRLDVRLEA